MITVDGPNRVVAWAARRLGPEHAARYQEEWQANLSDLDGAVARWYLALGAVVGAHRMRRPHRRPTRKQVLTVAQHAVGVFGVGTMIVLKIAPDPVLVPVFLATVPFVIRLGLATPTLVGQFFVNTALELNEVRLPAARPLPAPAPQPPAQPARTAVIITALPVEQQAVAGFLAEPAADRLELDARGTLFEIGTFTGDHGSWLVPVAQVGAGNVAAGLGLERAVTVFHPDVVLFVGVAGGLRDVRLGDVVVGETVLGYELGKEVDGEYQPRIRSHHPSHRLLQRARAVARQNRWQRRVRRHDPAAPQALVKPIAAGSKVIGGTETPSAELIRRTCGEAVAVEMEGYGFLEGAHVNDGVDAVVIRGVSDLLADKESAHDRVWQPVAADNAAAFAFELLDSIGRVG